MVAGRTLSANEKPEVSREGEVLLVSYLDPRLPLSLLVWMALVSRQKSGEAESDSSLELGVPIRQNGVDLLCEAACGLRLSGVPQRPRSVPSPTAARACLSWPRARGEDRPAAHNPMRMGIPAEDGALASTHCTHGRPLGCGKHVLELDFTLSFYLLNYCP